MMSRLRSRLTLLACALVAATAAMLGVVPASPAHAGPGDWWSPNRVFFWETWGYHDDGVELGPAPVGYNLKNVTRDCAVLCWNDWDNVPSSVWVQPKTVLTVWEYANRSGACANFDGGPESSPGSGSPGRGWYDLWWVDAGLPAGQSWDKRISSVLLTPYGTPGPSCAWANLRDRNPVLDGSFERQQTRTVSWPWSVEGVDYKGIDRGLGYSHWGANNAFIRTSSRNWNAITQQVPVRPNTTYTIRAWVRTSGNYNSGYFGVRPQGSSAPFAETRYGPTGGYQMLSVRFYSGANTSVTVFAGYWAPGADSWVQIDDVSLEHN